MSDQILISAFTLIIYYITIIIYEWATTPEPSPDQLFNFFSNEMKKGAMFLIDEENKTINSTTMGEPR